MGTQGYKRRTVANLALDAALAVGFLAAMRPFLMGVALHEWLGLAVSAGVIAHAALHHRWLVGVTRRLRGGCPLRTRLYWALDAALGAGFIAILVTGVAISRNSVPVLAVRPSDAFAWVAAHRIVSYVTLGLLGGKLATHWRSLTHMVRHVAQGPKVARPVPDPCAAPLKDEAAAPRRAA